MRPLRIAHVLTTLGAGGAERQALALAERLPRERYRIDFLAVGGSGEYDDRARAAGARVLHLGARPVPGEARLAGHQRRLAVMARFVRAVRRGGYDIVDAWLYPDDVRAALTRGLTGTRIVMSGRRNIQPHARFGPLAGALDRVLDRLVDAVVANSEATASFALGAHHTSRAKLHVIHNGVDLVEPLAEPERQAWRRRMAVGDDDIVIGCVGRYRQVKRQTLLIDAFATLAADRPRVRLVFVGEGDLRPRMEERIAALGIEQSVRLHGMELDPRPMYGAFDLVAQASASEGLPNVLLEAGAAGCPVVATDAGGSREIVVDGVTGLLVPTEDIDALAAGLRRMVDDPDLRRRTGHAARARVADAFGMDRFVREYGDLYQALARAKGLGPDLDPLPTEAPGRVS